MLAILPQWLFYLLSGLLLGLLAGAAGVWYAVNRTSLEEEVEKTLVEGDNGPAEFEAVEVSLTPMDWIRAGRHL
ncbi:hypothetical protein DEQ92_20790, partial [Haloferax sp. Atlit-6N]|uniref:hypothetical protein n=1 Tax=Haloferax sp. Atlit-6N TaxID=2077205 RepID=UPI000E393D62